MELCVVCPVCNGAIVLVDNVLKCKTCGVTLIYKPSTTTKVKRGKHNDKT